MITFLERSRTSSILSLMQSLQQMYPDKFSAPVVQTPNKVQTLCCAGHDGIYVLGAENGTIQLWQRDASVDVG